MFQKKFEREKIEIEVFIFQNFFFSAWSEIEVKASSGISRKRKKRKRRKFLQPVGKLLATQKKDTTWFETANVLLFGKFLHFC